MKSRLLPTVLVLITGAASAVSVPTTIAGTRPIDLSAEAGLRDTVVWYARQVQVDCPVQQGYRYSVPADATAGLNAWLQAQGLTAKTIQQSPGSVVWLASPAGAGEQMLGMYSAAGSGGTLVLCGASGRVGASSEVVSSVSADLPGRSVWKYLGMGVLVLVSIVGKVSGLVRRLTGGGEA